MPPLEWRDEYGHLSLYAFFTIQFVIGTLAFTLGYVFGRKDEQDIETRKYKDLP